MVQSALRIGAGTRVTKKFDKRVLKQPRWIAAIIIGLLISVTFVRLGLWQLDRLDERRAENATIEGRMVEPPRPFVGIIGQYATPSPRASSARKLSSSRSAAPTTTSRGRWSRRRSILRMDPF
jgi:hypothetical protein